MAAPIRIALFNLKGPLAELDADAGSRVADLKRRIAGLCGLPPSCQSLTVGSRIAGNSEQLGRLRDGPDATLSMTVVNTVYQRLTEGQRHADRVDALNYLATSAEKNDANVIAMLLERLTDANNDVRSAAVMALAEVVVPAAPELGRLLAHEDNTVRCEAARFLGRTGKEAEPFVGSLVQLLADGDVHIRRAAVQALELLGEHVASAAVDLARLMGDGRGEVREAASDLVLGLGTLAAPAAPTLAELLAHEDWQVRHASSNALTRLGEAAFDAAPALLRLLQHGDQRVRHKALSGLAELGPHALPRVPEMTRLLADSSSEVRGAAARALGKLAPQEEREFLLAAFLEMLSDTSDLVRFEAEKAMNCLLGSSDGAQRCKRALKGLKADDWLVRVRAAWDLGALGVELGLSPVVLLPEFEALLGDAKAQVRIEALKALRRCGQLAAPLAPQAERLSSDGHAGVRREALQMLAALGEEASKAISVQEPGIRSKARTALSRDASKAVAIKEPPKVPIEEAERMLAGVSLNRCTSLDKLQQLKDIAKLALPPVRLTTFIPCCDAGHACRWAHEVPQEYLAEDNLAVDCDVCGARDLQARAATTPFCHCSTCSFDFCASCAVERAGSELARMFREERECVVQT